MSAFLKLLYVRFRPYFPMIYALLFAAIAVAAAYYAYNYLYLPGQKDKVFKNVANSSPNGRTITIFLYHVDWCPHCKKALPEWQAFSDVYNGKQINGYQIECKEVDCTNDKDPNIKLVVDKYSLKQFPTVIAILPGPDGKEMRVDYEAKVKKDYLEKFANSVALENSGM